MSIHASAIIDRQAELDPSVEVGPYAVIEGPVRVGADTKIGAHAHLRGWTRIGESCSIHMGAVVGHEPQDLAFTGERSYCEIGDGTVIREYATVHRGTDPESTTVVGAECLLAATSHVAHNCVVGDRVIMMNGAMLAGHVHVGAGAFLSGGAGIHQFVHVGELVMVSGHAEMVCDVPPFLMVFGRNRVAGINRVGMRRANLLNEEIEEIRVAFKRLYRSGKPLPVTIAELDKTMATPPGRRMVEFLQAKRKRPLIRPRSRRSISDED
ncbi:MAG: acyl-ACP--UDP-N-acetylglucosamine O-acyltransferase [bacterium]|nr:acyl-ACP--UDP-N-acetylglucosamine O-acyltransferase [bacterium]